VLAGCATSSEKLLPRGEHTMLDIWRHETGGYSGGQAGRLLLDARQELRRPLTDADTRAAPARNAAYTRTAANEIQRQFHRLPNPDLVIYVFPHLAGTDSVPVPGYSTVFPLYQRVQYAMPGERLEDYCWAGACRGCMVRPSGQSRPTPSRTPGRGMSPALPRTASRHLAQPWDRIIGGPRHWPTMRRSMTWCRPSPTCCPGSSTCRTR